MNESGGDQQEAHGASLDSSYNGPRREIGRCMPMNDIRCTWTVLEIKETKWSYNYLNRTVIYEGVILMLKTTIKNRYN
jgi:hypothetical protein